MKRGIKLRVQTADLPERKVRLRLSGRLASELDAYRELYAEMHGHEIELAALVEGMLEQFLASDRFFHPGVAEARNPLGSSSSSRET